ncbi:MAG: dihydroorotate dehydrogenase, partial [Chloroflexi bacterium]
IAGETIEEFVEVAERIEGVEGVAGIEVNVSCPNLRAGGAVFGADPQAVADVTAAVRRATTLPIIVKLSPNSVDTRARRPVLAHGTGGLSGPAVKPIALRMVYEVACELRASHPNVPVIGIGGIANAGDALEFLMAGASAIQVGTINFVNPRAGVEIVEGIEAFLKREGVASIEEIVGSAL